MKKFFFLTIAFIVIENSNAQNVGIGTATPIYKLDIVGRLRLQNSAGTAGVYFDGTTLPIRSFIGTLNDDHFGIYGNGGASWGITMNVNNGNVGIGEQAPAYKLDLNGRMRLQHTSNTAGIYFDGVTLPTRSFIGTLNDDHFGIYGSGAGWNFIMNVENGNIGIGTSTPTAPLDVNGAIRIRGGNPAAGSVLTSIDANGNAIWKTQKVAFCTRWARNVAMPDAEWRKAEFELEDYDATNSFLPYAGATTTNSSKFTAPVSGVYHFSAFGDIYLNSNLYNLLWTEFALVINGVQRFQSQSDSPINTIGFSTSSNSITVTVHLNAGDQVWIEAYQFNDEGLSCGFSQTQNSSSFSGHLIYAD